MNIAEYNLVKKDEECEFEEYQFKEDKYPSDDFTLFDTLLGIISLAVLFILFW